MIERYTLPEMGRVWSDQRKYELWCRVETLVLEAHAAAGRVPAEVVQPVRDAPPPTPERVAEIEETTQHDVIAFLTAWADNTEPRSAAAYVHHGMTSSDLLDTALAVQLTEATDLLLARLDRLVAVLRDHGLAHRDTIKVGRTHGVHAEPDVWGHRVADIAFAAARSRDRLRAARERVGVVAISGAVGTYSLIDPSVEVAVAEALGLRPADASTQVVLRDSISEWVSALAIIATVCEAIALEVRHGQRTEGRELSEAFGSGQKGSSAMPHKKNPIRSERTAGLVENLVVDADRMRANLESTGGLIYTSSVLLELVEGGLSREDAYALVQSAAMETWNSGTPFRETLRARAKDAGVVLDEARLDDICRPERYVANLGPLFDRLAALS